MPQESSNSSIEQLGKLFDVHLLKQIIANMPPEPLLQWRRVSKRYNNLVINDLLKNELLWRNKLALHFPFYPVENSLNAFANFQKAYKQEYATMKDPAQKALFSAAKEGSLNLEEVNKIDDLLAIVDTNGLTVLDWLVIKKQQSLLNEIHEKFFGDFTSCQRILSIINRTDRQSYPISFRSIAFYSKENVYQLLWAIRCQQPFATIQQVAISCELFPQLILMVLYEASRLGNLNAVAYFYEFINDELKNQDVFKQQLFSTLKEVAKLGHIEVVNFFLQKPDCTQELIDSVIEEAVCGGHLNLVNSLRNKIEPVKLLEFAACSGRENIVKELLGEQTFHPNDITATLKRVTIYGKIDIIKCICDLQNDNKPMKANLLTAINSVLLNTTLTQSKVRCIIYLTNQLDSTNKEEVGRIINNELNKAIQDKKWDVAEHLMFILFNTNFTPGKIINQFAPAEKKFVFAAICKKDTDPLQKVRSLLQCYAQGRFYKQETAVFWNKNDSQQKAADIVKQIEQGEIKNGEELREKLAEIKSGGIISQLKQYIDEEIFPQLNARSRKRKSRDQEETSLHEKSAKFTK